MPIWVPCLRPSGETSALSAWWGLGSADCHFTLSGSTYQCSFVPVPPIGDLNLHGKVLSIFIPVYLERRSAPPYHWRASRFCGHPCWGFMTQVWYNGSIKQQRILNMDVIGFLLGTRRCLHFLKTDEDPMAPGIPRLSLGWCSLGRERA